MALKSELMAGGLVALLANRLGLDPLSNVAAAGSGESTATDLTTNCWKVTSGSGGVQINSAEQIQFGINGLGGNLSVYPPNGLAFNGGTADAAVTVPTGKTILIIPAAPALLAIISA